MHNSEDFLARQSLSDFQWLETGFEPTPTLWSGTSPGLPFTRS
jgi:hypothetical protein